MLHTTFSCLLYISDAADEFDGVDLGGRRLIKQKFSLITWRKEFLSRLSLRFFKPAAQLLSFSPYLQTLVL
ncbi:hypothetical protein LKL54_15470, partial [Listeria monocytogenes ATCC 19115]